MATSPNDIYAEWRAAYELLQSGEYEKATELLRTVQITHTQNGNILAATTAGAARQICLALIAYQNEIDWHQLASGNAELRERTLNQHALSMLALVGEQVTNPFTPPVPRQPPTAPPVRPAAPKEHVSLWQRIQNLFDRQRRAARKEPHSWPEPPQLLGPATEMPKAVAQPAEATPPEQLPPHAPVFPLAPQAVEPAEMALPPRPSEIVHPDAATESEPAMQTNALESAPEIAITGHEPPALTVYCLGPFRVFQDNQPVTDWPSNKGLSIFKFLVTHRERPVAKEVLMEHFWPDANPDAARNNLNVAIYGLRRALRRTHPDYSHVLFQNDSYLLNPTMHIWVDVEEFVRRHAQADQCTQTGQLEEAIDEYRAAEAFYQGEFLEEDRYEDWIVPVRQSLQDEYVGMLEQLSNYYLEQHDLETCILMANKMIAVDSCYEEAHRRLMRCYCRQGYQHLALRQYHLCVEALANELDVEPSTETLKLYVQIRQQSPV
ncbi:MAG: winged helix-turn-helix domain-containing protein [Caldilineaceae bacterium]|nr:winged helix-turn-helix domain-containing protein [Caldilineaceae bacterium]